MALHQIVPTGSLQFPVPQLVGVGHGCAPARLKVAPRKGGGGVCGHHSTGGSGAGGESGAADPYFL
ncbi:MAG: hypothetical protein ABFS30_10685 [Pseudomonadota bacterium]